MQLQVTVNKLNKRKGPVLDFANKGNVVEVLNKDAVFESVGTITNTLGIWHFNRDGHFIWEKGVTDSKQTFKWFADLGIENIWNKYGEKGDNVTVAVLDTGYNIANDDIKPSVIAVNIFDNSGQIQNNDIVSPLINDSIGHGTFCASLISARNSNQYILGIAPKSKLLIGKISNTGGLSPTGLDTILEGIEWSISAGAEIISVSFGKFGNEIPDDPNYLVNIQNRLNEIIQNKKVLIFASSGDNPQGMILQKERYPASLDNCISVGATDEGKLSQITVLSHKTIIHAQGIDVSSYLKTMTPEKRSGTSMSTPIVAGVASLAVSYLKKKNGTWAPSDLLNKIYESGDPIPDKAGKKTINPQNLFSIL